MKARRFHKMLLSLAGITCVIALVAGASPCEAEGKVWEKPFESILGEAETGDAGMQFLAGWTYTYGRPGVRIDYEKAASWYGKSAGHGNANAAAMLGYLHFQGLGVKWDPDKALGLWKKSLPGLESGAGKGNVYSLQILSDLIVNGKITYGGKENAVKMAKQAAEAGEPQAMNHLGQLYAMGYGVDRNYGEARKWYETAAEAGNSHAMYNMGSLYRGGLGVERNYVQAMIWYKKAANLGHSTATNDIGWLYYQGGHGIDRNFQLALKWYRMAADMGHSMAMSNIGWLYQEGHGVTRDYGEALEWYRRAAERRNAIAMNNIGLLYANGWGVEQDHAEALKWFKSAADLGYATAMFNVGSLYRYGLGVEQNPDEAGKWFEMAAAAGHRGAKEELEKMKDESSR